MATQAVKVQRGYIEFGSSDQTISISPGVDYDAPASNSAAFLRITHSRLTGAGFSGGQEYPDEFSVWVNDQSDLVSTGATFERYGQYTGGQNARVYWEIVEYVGSSGGPNEFIVHDSGVLILDGTNLTADSPNVAGISSTGDCVIFNTGQGNSNNGNTSYWLQFLHTYEFVAGPAVRATRGGSNASYPSKTSYAVVEFTGSNWTVNRAEISPADTSHKTEQTYSLGFTLADLTKSFVHVQYRTTASSTGLDDAGMRCRLASTTQLGVYSRASASWALADIVVWVVENSQADGSARNLTVQRGTGSQGSGGSEPETWTVSVTTVDDMAEASAGLTVASTGTGTYMPRGSSAVTLSAVNQITLYRGETGQSDYYAWEAWEWPEDPAGGADNTGSAAVETGGVSASASATHTAPTFTGSAAPSTGGVEASASATNDTPGSQGSAAPSTSDVSAIASATHTPPTFTASAAVTVGGADCDVSATFTPGDNIGSASATVGGADVSASATFTPSTGRTASADLEVGGVQADGSATFDLGTFTASVAVTIGGVSVRASERAVVFVFKGRPDSYAILGPGPDDYSVRAGADDYSVRAEPDDRYVAPRTSP